MSTNRYNTIILITLYYRSSQIQKNTLTKVVTMKPLLILNLTIVYNTFLSKLLKLTEYYVLHSTKKNYMFAVSK